MAAPITHIVLTQKIFNKFFKDKIRKDFFIGSCFPDIRYLKVIDRGKTHFEHTALNGLKQDNSFSAGVKFHSILDVVREKFITENNIYPLCPKSKYVTESLKILEDQIYYPYISNWGEYIDYLNEILPDELSFGITKIDIEKWHSLLQRYFSRQPDIESVKSTIGIGFSKKAVSIMNNNVEKMRVNKKIINIIKNLYKNLDSLLNYY